MLPPGAVVTNPDLSVFDVSSQDLSWHLDVDFKANLLEIVKLKPRWCLLIYWIMFFG